MRTPPLLALIGVLAACVPEEAPVAADPCGANRNEAFVGQPATVIPAALPGRSQRIIRPGDMVTEDYSDQRINYYLDAGDRVSRITCG